MSYSIWFFLFAIKQFRIMSIGKEHWHNICMHGFVRMCALRTYEHTYTHTYMHIFIFNSEEKVCAKWSGPVITWSIVMVLVSFRNGGALEFERKSWVLKEWRPILYFNVGHVHPYRFASLLVPRVWPLFLSLEQTPCRKIRSEDIFHLEAWY